MKLTWMPWCFAEWIKRRYPSFSSVATVNIWTSSAKIIWKFINNDDVVVKFLTENSKLMQKKVKVVYINVQNIRIDFENKKNSE